VPSSTASALHLGHSPFDKLFTKHNFGFYEYKIAANSYKSKLNIH